MKQIELSDAEKLIDNLNTTITRRNRAQRASLNLNE